MPRASSLPASPPYFPPAKFKDDAPAAKIFVALKRAVEKTFDSAKWREVAYLLGKSSIVEDHPRLLRSLYWGDDDYPANAFSVLKELTGERFERLNEIVEFAGLKDWLRENDQKLYLELCEDSTPNVPLEQCETVASVHNIGELGRQAARIRSALEDGSDPELAIGSAKELLESVLKTVTGDHGQKPTEDIQILLRKAQKELELDPKDVTGTLPGAESLRRTLSNLGQIVVGVAELRTLYGTGHGRSKSRELKLAHARLVVNAAISVATFLLEVWQEKQS